MGEVLAEKICGGNRERVNIKENLEVIRTTLTHTNLAGLSSLQGNIICTESQNIELQQCILGLSKNHQWMTSSTQ